MLSSRTTGSPCATTVPTSANQVTRPSTSVASLESARLTTVPGMLTVGEISVRRTSSTTTAAGGKPICCAPAQHGIRASAPQSTVRATVFPCIMILRSDCEAACQYAASRHALAFLAQAQQTRQQNKCKCRAHAHAADDHRRHAAVEFRAGPGHHQQR